MDLAKLAAWRSALEREAARMVASGVLETDADAPRRLRWLEFQMDLIDERIQETVGSSE